MTYIATFHSHFAAVSFARQLKGTNMKPMFMPVPRKLSSSCGTCVRFEYEGDVAAYAAQEMDQEDLDCVYLVQGEEEYLPQYHASAD